MDPDNDMATGSGDSFNSKNMMKMKYSDFLDKMSSFSIGIAMKDS